MGGSDEPKDKWASRLTKTKDGLDILRQLLVVLILLLLMFWRTPIKNLMTDLNVSKVGLGGAEFDFAQKTSEKTGDTAQRLEETSKNLASVQEQLNYLARRANNPEVKTELDKLNSDVGQSLETTRNAQQNLTASLAIQTSIVQNAAPQDVSETGPWGIVISADRQLNPDAQNEVTVSKEHGFQNVKVYDRQGWLRTVIEFSSLEESQAALPKIRSIPPSHHNSAYLVNMTKWCPTRNDKGGGVIQCL